MNFMLNEPDCSGYMAPEYAFDGKFSVKSDVFSLGVVILEIVSGKKNRGFKHPCCYQNLLEQVKDRFPLFFFICSMLRICLMTGMATMEGKKGVGADGSMLF